MPDRNARTALESVQSWFLSTLSYQFLSSSSIFSLFSAPWSFSQVIMSTEVSVTDSMFMTPDLGELSASAWLSHVGNSPALYFIKIPKEP